MCSVWKLVVLLSFGFFFEFYDLFYSGYVVLGFVKSGILFVMMYGLFGIMGVVSFIVVLFFGFFIGMIVCGFFVDCFGCCVIFMWLLLWYMVVNVVMVF